MRWMLLIANYRNSRNISPPHPDNTQSPLPAREEVDVPPPTSPSDLTDGGSDSVVTPRARGIMTELMPDAPPAVLAHPRHDNRPKTL